MSPTPPLLDVQDLTVSVLTDEGSLDLVRELSFAVESGQTLCVVGESGSGKTVTALSIIRLLEFVAPTSTRGEIRIDDVDVTGLTPEQMRHYRGSRIGMVFQEALDSLNPSQRIGAQLVEAFRGEGRDGIRSSARPRGARLAEANERAASLLREVGLTDTDRVMALYPHQLSGGMQQRVMIAMALMASPDLLLADEPTTALDVTTQAEILKLFRRVQQEHRMGCIFITHDMGVAAEIADRIAVMYGGHLVEVGSTHDILTAPRHRYTRALMECVPRVGVSFGSSLPTIRGSVPGAGDELPGCRFAPRCGFATAQCTTIRPELSPATPAHHVACWNPGVGGLDAPAPLEEATAERTANGTGGVVIDDLTRVFRTRSGTPGRWGVRRRADFAAVDHVDLEIAPGEFFGLVGESGSGKTTLGQLVTALDRPSSGSIRIGDHVVDARGVSGSTRDFRRRVQLIFQDPQSSLDPRHTVRRIIAEPLVELTDLRGSALTAKVEELLDEVGLPRRILDQVPSQISGGQRQRVAIARAIAPGPDLIVADEPTSALDVSVQGQVMNLLLELRRERGLGYLFITHNLSLILSVADRIGVMKQGRIVELATPAEIVADPKHEYTRTLLAANPSLPVG